MGLLLIVGNIVGVVIAGRFIDASQPQTMYQQSLWISYGMIMIILIVLMLVTIFTVRERASTSTQLVALEENSPRAARHAVFLAWFTRSMLYTIVGTVVVAGVVWGLMAAWNALPITSGKINGESQQVMLEIVVAVGLLRMFDFNPRRDPDFAWVFLTRLAMMMGIYTIQTFLQYYMRDVVGATHPELQTTKFVIVVSLTSLLSAVTAGWLSDRFGRKRIVYISGAFMALVGLVFVLFHSLPIVIAAGAIFGLGYGAYQSVDWALVADVLPSQRDYARDMGVWNISLALPQIIAPVLGGPLIDAFTKSGRPVLGYQILFIMAIIFCLLGTVTIRYIKGVKR